MRHDLGDGVFLNTRNEWAGDDGRYLPRGNGTPRALRDLREFIVHHSGGVTLGDPDPRQWIRSIYGYHVGTLGYVDVAYDLFVDEDGELWEGRNSLIAGAHTRNHNFRGYAVCLLRAKGDRDDDRNVPIKVQRALRKAYQLTQWLVFLDGGPELAQTTHRRCSGNSSHCPGDDVDEFVITGGLTVPFGASTKPPAAVPKPVPPKPAPGGEPSKAWPLYGGKALKKRSSGERVRQWQERLRFLGLQPGPVDGKFGKQTEHATKVFQGLRGLAVDGIVGPITWAEAGIDRRK